MSKPTTYKIHLLYLQLLQDYCLKEVLRGSKLYPKGTALLPPRDNEWLLLVQTDKKGKLICAKYTTAHRIIQGVRANPNKVCYTKHIAPKPKPKRKRATSILALEKVPNQPAPTLHTLNEKLEGLSDIVKSMEASKNLRDKLIEDMDTQLGIGFKLICSLNRDKDKLVAEVAPSKN